MNVLPVNPSDNPTPGALRTFLSLCAENARATGRPQLASISMAVESLDPLAVLESIFEADEIHFYAERPAQGFAVAGAEAVLEHVGGGPDRFARARAWIEEVLAATIAVGPVDEPFAGPHFFLSATFSPGAPADRPFPGLRVFVPRWQVSRMGDGSVAVANIPVPADAPVDLLAERVWKAHAKFRSFDYSVARRQERPPAPGRRIEVGETGWYRRAVATALEEIARGDYAKVVLGRAQKFETDAPFHPLGVLNHLRRRYPECYAFSVGSGLGPSFIGASPERLIRVAHGRLHTEALAGSAPRGRSASEDARLARALQQDEKERHEHQLVIDAIGSQLSDLGIAIEYPAVP
ncbi:MAG TPA: chorismate-binding protein, partial [Candidatus Didemnitutus sp.]